MRYQYVFLTLLSLSQLLSAVSCDDVFKSGLQADNTITFKWKATLFKEADHLLEASEIKDNRWANPKSCDSVRCEKGSTSRVIGDSITFPDVDNANDISTTWNQTTVKLKPETYGKVTIEANHVLSLEDGVYYFRELIVNNEAEIIITNGTARVFVRDGIRFESSSLINCSTKTTANDPSSLVLFSNNTIVTGDSMCISGYIYTLGDFGTAKIEGRGSFSSKNLELASNTHITTDLSDLKFMDFGPLCTNSVAALPAPPMVDYKLDECYYLSGANGINGDIIDSTAPHYHASSVSRIDSNQTDAKICRSGAFSDNSYAVVDTPFVLDDVWTMSVWINFPFVKTGKRYYILGSYPTRGDLPVFEYINSKLKWGVYDNNGALKWNSFDNTLNGWHHLAFVNDNGTTTLYVDGVLKNDIPLSTKGNVAYLWTSSDDLGGQSIASNIDEMKIFSTALTNSQIEKIFFHENAGQNYDGTTRECPKCSSTTILAGNWGLIGVPSDLRQTTVTVSDIFSDDMKGVFNSDWKIYKRVYNSNDNSGSYQSLGLNDSLDFGVAYWLGSKKDERWNVDGTTAVNYDSTNSECQGTQCVELDLQSVSKNFGLPDNDPNDGSGPYRYYYSGFIGLDKPIDWSDCRFIIDSKVYTPSQAEVDGFVSKQIWLYNPKASLADANGYTTCDDSTPGTCKLLPFKGFVVELHGKTKNKTVKLLIPKD